ncbi:MAG: DUF3604 domain-containing protein, partial [Planctomycetota bacterium]
MSYVNYPPAFHHRVITLEAPGGAPASVAVVAPTVAATGEPFRLHVAVLDADGYPSVGFEGSVWVRAEFAGESLIEVPFRAGRAAVAQVERVSIAEEGLFRFEARLGDALFYSNPVCCQRRPERRIFWGDPHVHTVISDCHPDRCRSLNFCYAAARYLTGLDWATAADHVSNGRCEFARWKEQMAAAEAFDDRPDFVTLPGYEASLRGGCGGDTNPYFRRPPDRFVDEFEDGNVKTLCEKLAEAVDPADFFVVPHHTTRTGKHGEIPDAIYPGPELMPVVEIHSKWGTSEHRGNPNALHDVHPGPSYAVDFLRRGLRLGFIAGTDSHATMPSGRGVEAGHIDRLPGLTAVFADGLSRDAIFDGIRSRDCYAASGERIYLDVAVTGVPMGRMVQWPELDRPRPVQVVAAARSDIETVEIVRNGETLHRHPVGDWQTGFLFSDEESLGGLWLDSAHLGRFVYYYIRVTCVCGAQAWS